MPNGLPWTCLRNRRPAGCRFCRRVPVGEDIFDFVCFEREVVIEVDGGHHQVQASYDTERTAWLESQGFQVPRFWNHEVPTDTEADRPRFLWPFTGIAFPLITLTLALSRQGRGDLFCKGSCVKKFAKTVLGNVRTGKHPRSTQTNSPRKSAMKERAVAVPNPVS